MELTAGLVIILKNGLAAIFRRGAELSPFFSCGGRHCARDSDVAIPCAEIDGGGGGEDLSSGDVAAVLERLGMGCGGGGGEGEEEVVVGELLEMKEASEWELREAFHVFDRDEDGFVTADELWNVMRRLGFEEGRRVEDCERMIRVFDEDGDGKIGLLEFKRLLENTV